MKESKYLSHTGLLSIKRRKRKTKLLPETQVLHEMPGSLIYTGERHVEHVRIELIQFNEKSFEETTLELDDLSNAVQPDKVTWINLVGLHDVEIVKEIGRQFNIHNLALEDILNVNQRPVFDDYEDNYFLAAKMLKLIKDQVVSEQFSLVVGDGYIITFQEKLGDIFDGVRNRLRKAKGRIRSRKSDYLAFALLDVIVDHYLAIIEVYGDAINDQEVQLLDGAHKEALAEINLVKKEVNILRKYARPLKDAVINLNKSDSNLIEKKTRPFLKDLLEHTSHVMESIEVYRETINDNLNTYHTHMTNKLNDILKVLTIFSVIFIPLTFMAGIYGMNFEFMPELGYKYAYPIFWAVIISVAISMIVYFRKRKWL